MNKYPTRQHEVTDKLNSNVLHYLVTSKHDSVNVLNQ